MPELAELYRNGCKPKRGQMVLLTGMPKAGKSLLGLWWVHKMGLPTLYVSADMDSHEAMTRLSATVTGTPSDQVAEHLLQQGGPEFYQDAVRDSQIQWVFDSAPTLWDLADELDAYVEAHGVWPEVIVIDNLMNVVGESDGDDPTVGMQGILKELHGLARETGAAIFVLHHVSEAVQTDATVPAPRRGIQGKVSQLPEVVLTVALEPATNRFGVACVANRGGPCDPTGKRFIKLKSRPELCRFEHWTGY
ncbi:AAA family ATPase [Kineococcus sp. NPDC059986]|uniref:AAA family ATPase n=1 Tax=Kineococcus sp. NPDC059986 TaxID=3155538 RepID=UPI00344F76AB